MLQKLRRRLAADQSGFTLIELLVVIVIIGILLAIAVPSYLGFRDRANSAAAQSNVRAAIPSAEAFFADNATYVGLGNSATPTPPAPPGMASYDASVASTVVLAPAPNAPTATTYCFSSTVGGKQWYVKGPGGTIKEVKTGQVLCS